MAFNGNHNQLYSQRYPDWAASWHLHNKFITSTQTGGGRACRSNHIYGYYRCRTCSCYFCFVLWQQHNVCNPMEKLPASNFDKPLYIWNAQILKHTEHIKSPKVCPLCAENFELGHVCIQGSFVTVSACSIMHFPDTITGTWGEQLLTDKC